MKRFETVDAFIKAQKEWRVELKKLREILNATPLDEEIKWGAPCYTYQGKNLVGLGAFKSYFGLWFFQGALLKDPKQVLINCQEGRTKAMRQWRMEAGKEIKSTVIKAYIKEAMKLVDNGIEIKPDRNKPLVVPPQLEKALKSDKKAHESFKKMPRGKQREYTDYIAQAKRAETKQTRLKKILPLISKGVGLNDRYR